MVVKMREMFNIEEIEKKDIPDYSNMYLRDFIYKIYFKSLKYYRFERDDYEDCLNVIYDYQDEQFKYFCEDNGLNKDDYKFFHIDENPCYPIIVPLNNEGFVLLMENMK
mgnify:CR=1 FL=1